MDTRFYTIEGIDGCGKSTLVKNLVTHFTEAGKKIKVVNAYPSDSDAAFMRAAWVNQKIPMPAVLSCILYLRRRVLVEEVFPALLDDYVVITDRFNDSTWVYQHYTQGIPKDLMIAMFNYHLDLDLMLDNLSSDQAQIVRERVMGYRTIFMNIDAQTAVNRVQARIASEGGQKDAFESKPLEFFQNLVRNYQFQYQVKTDLVTKIDAHRSDVMYVDATQDASSVLNQALSLITTYSPSLK